MSSALPGSFCLYFIRRVSACRSCSQSVVFIASYFITSLLAVSIDCLVINRPLSNRKPHLLTSIVYDWRTQASLCFLAKVPECTTVFIDVSILFLVFFFTDQDLRKPTGGKDMAPVLRAF